MIITNEGQGWLNFICTNLYYHYIITNSVLNIVLHCTSCVALRILSSPIYLPLILFNGNIVHLRRRFPLPSKSLPVSSLSTTTLYSYQSGKRAYIVHCTNNFQCKCVYSKAVCMYMYKYICVGYMGYMVILVQF